MNSARTLSVCIYYIICVQRSTTRLYIYICYAAAVDAILPSRRAFPPIRFGKSLYPPLRHMCFPRIYDSHINYTRSWFFSRSTPIAFTLLQICIATVERYARVDGGAGWLCWRVSGEIYARGSSDAIESTAILSSTIAASITRSPKNKNTTKMATDASW